MFGLGLGEIVIVLIALGAVYTLFLSPPARRRFSGGVPDERPPLAPGADASEAGSAEEILAQRYARGELTDAEFAMKRDLIRQGRPE